MLILLPLTDLLNGGALISLPEKCRSYLSFLSHRPVGRKKTEVREVMFQSLKAEAFFAKEMAARDLKCYNNIQECYRNRHGIFYTQGKFHVGFPAEHSCPFFPSTYILEEALFFPYEPCAVRFHCCFLPTI